jgi:hypothetical protein
MRNRTAGKALFASGAATTVTFGLIAIAMVVVINSRAFAQTVTWSGHDATDSINFDWSDVNNWTGGTPGPKTNICFLDPGANNTEGFHPGADYEKTGQGVPQ